RPGTSSVDARRKVIMKFSGGADARTHIRPSTPSSRGLVRQCALVHMSVSPGTRLGPYEIVAPIGAGGMGEVWRAKDTRLDRSVAIKVLSADLANDPQLRMRLEREAKTISHLNHPNICTIYDVGDGYLVMELLEAETPA